ncbi:MAG: ATP-binding cassette domain-containing protein [Methanotrichaceae archaeon]|jgi:ABC-2 type transport system ATP-binding protein
MLAIEVRRLAKVYAGTVKALDGIDFDVNAGDVFAMLGPNGSGKTTLMRILTTQFKPTSGEARIFGLDVVKDDAEVRKNISYVPQETSVWTDISGYENLLIYAKIYGIPSNHRNQIIWESLQKMGLDEVANKLVKTYSGGMIRRLELACATIIKPRLLFLDEPTIGLDPSARKAIWENLISFKKECGTTVFFNTHYMDEADHYSNEIAIIDRGKMVKFGTPSELKQSLRREIIQFSLVNRDIDENVLERIRSLGFVNEITVYNSVLNVVVDDAETALPDVMELLRLGGISVKKISTSRPTLDDVFLKYAGIMHSTSSSTSSTMDSTDGKAMGEEE